MLRPKGGQIVNASLPPALLQYMADLKAHDVEMIGASLAEDVQLVTPAKTMDKPMILQFLATLYHGFPDWSYDHDEPELLEDGFFCALAAGWHTGPLALIQWRLLENR